ncbi:FAD-dependent monooxygenase [Kocuria sp. CPCC 205292]|uniref:FAD-dependent monooxygenase n=1 Tax=Kocuria cellulosilytica TaxID=3071451 RepID=UPI0034D5B61A
MTTTGRRIAVVGAGIGGLTLAIELRRRGLEVEVYEAAGELREVGAAVALSANATRFFLERFGLEERLSARWAEVEALVFRDGRDGRLIGRHGTGYRERFGAPYVGIHRADLQQILSGALGTDGLHLSKRLVDVDDDGAAAVLRFEDGSTAEADLVIGADGARSTTRRLLLGYDDALYSGTSASRGIVPPEALSELPDPGAIQFWTGPGAHLLHYPIGGGDQNFFLVERAPSPWPHRRWVVPVEDGSHLERFRDWHPAVRQMVSAVPVTERWALFHRPPLSRWSRGRVTLLGDAAHALVPHHGQGANQSIEDAIVLADQLAGSADWDAAREQYERLRRGRTRKVQYASITTADVLHLPDGERADERNARLGRPDVVDRHLAWIHGFRADVDVPDESGGGTWL